MLDIKVEIDSIAHLFVGIKELGNNEGFEHKFFKRFNMLFEELMFAVGWKEGHAWCAYFAELVWKLAYRQDSTMVDRLGELFSANAVQTWKNFSNSEFDCSKIPAPGDVLIYQLYIDGKPTTSGHAAIVIKVNDGTLINTIEGNTNIKGSRDGDGVHPKKRKINFEKTSGLVPLGFIHLKLLEL